ncbi:MAG: hypothetical protein ABI592_11955 [Acidobacteriota bacterium]
MPPIPKNKPTASTADRSATELERSGRRGLPALLRRPELAALAAAAERRGAEVWIVGGAARDLLLGRRGLDVDLAVTADPMLLARDLERAGFGTAVEISASAPRVARVAGTREIDLAAVEGVSIGEDLRRRDFTVNALAIGLVGRLWSDPLGGVRDLVRRRLRMVSEKNLVDDPLRVLRGARLIATHGLSPDASTTRACRRVAPLLSTAAPERVRAELVKLLAALQAAPALAWAARVGALGPTLRLPISDRAAAASLRRIPLDARGVAGAPPAARVPLRLALLARGLGLDPEGAAAWLGKLRFSRREAADVARTMRLADAARRGGGDLALWEWVRDAAGSWEAALRLASLENPPLPPARRAALSRRARSARRPPRVTGKDVLDWLGISAGPEVGRILREIEVEGMRGGVRTRADARRWIKRRVVPIPDGAAPDRRLPKL